MKNIILIAFTFLISNLLQAGTVVVTQKDKQFSQKEVKLKKGDSIEFKNSETDITHNVYSLGPKNAFELKIQKPGESSTIEFKEAGETQIECAIHPGMNIKVTVE